MTTYDTIIIGSGAAGAILAARLSEDAARTVLLLEAGPDYPTLDQLPDDLKYGFGTPAGILTVSHDWGYVSEASPQARAVALPRGRVIGGSSTVNAQVFLRGVPEDFALWAAQGNDLWSFERVMPYFLKLETDLDFQNEYHGADGPILVRRYPPDEWKPDQMAFYRACLDAGFSDCPDHNKPYSTGVGPYPLNNYQGIRQSTALKYLNPARGRANLTIRANAFVHGIVLHGNRATGVAVEIDGRQETVSGKEIILSAGAIGSPQLLMLSGIGPADQLRALDIAVVADRPGVGQNLRDHPAANMYWALDDDLVADPQKHWHQVGVRYTAAGSPHPNDMIVYIGAIPAGAVPIERQLLLRPTLNLELSAGELRLVSADPHIQPQLNYRYLSETADRVRLRECVRLCRELVEGAAFRDIVGARLQPTPADVVDDRALDEWLLRAVNSGHHSCSTCKMGLESEPLAVVDQTGRVYGVDDLRVIDASIMPDCVRANTNATVMMMAEYAAAMIRDWVE